MRSCSGSHGARRLYGPIAAVDHAGDCGGTHIHTETVQVDHRHLAAGVTAGTHTTFKRSLGSFLSVRGLNKIPAVPIQILEDGNRAIGLDAWLVRERDAASLHLSVVTPAIVCLQE